MQSDDRHIASNECMGCWRSNLAAAGISVSDGRKPSTFSNNVEKGAGLNIADLQNSHLFGRYQANAPVVKKKWSLRHLKVV